MSDYTLENREEVTNVLQSRVVENAPLREIIRVYAEAVKSAVDQLSDADLARSVIAAGYGDIIEAFNIPEPPAPEGGEGEAAAE
jgi:20S proteasome alpha/beta subunit